jgi:hypothetical protein
MRSLEDDGLQAWWRRLSRRQKLGYLAIVAMSTLLGALGVYDAIESWVGGFFG